MSIKRVIKSFNDALRGLRIVFRSEQNFRIQVVIAFFVTLGTIVLPLRSWEIIILFLMITLVLIMELLNTALEYFTDLLKPRLHNHVQIIKDIMAGAVLLTSIVALVVGLQIFVPHFLNFLK